MTSFVFFSVVVVFPFIYVCQIVGFLSFFLEIRTLHMSDPDRHILRSTGSL